VYFMPEKFVQVLPRRLSLIIWTRTQPQSYLSRIADVPHCRQAQRTVSLLISFRAIGISLS